MRYFYAVLALTALLLNQSSLFAQAECDGSRYYQEVFSNYTLQSDVTYGSNKNYQGTTQSLEMDIYSPSNDSETNRPLIVMAHGGSFLFGDKTQADIKPMAETFSKRGYVCASIEYRLGMDGFPFPGPDSSNAMEAVVRAVQDARAAIRFFYKSAANGNPYGIDTNRIYFMGSSAGAFIGIHLAYLEDISQLPPGIDTTKAGMGGGIEGHSGNPGYSSAIQGVVNYSGAIGDTSWMKAGDVPIISFHGTSDGTVPYGTAVIVLSGFYPLMEVDGSHSIHIRAANLGMDNCLYTFKNGGHVPYVGNAAYTDTTLNLAVPWLAKHVCGSGNFTCAYVPVSVGVEDNPLSQMEVYPNPAGESARLRLPEGVNEAEVSLLDFQGRILRKIHMTTPSVVIPKGELSAGIYLIRVESEGKVATEKLIFH
ncbi:MAG: carboxylesterase family protein [Bacteroidia bacterium]|nr:carboxylesterase family protein [Bacteroidia bacterium]